MYVLPFVLKFRSLMFDLVPVTFGELKETLPSVYTLAWTAISERLLEKHVRKLGELSKEDKASLSFLQIFGYVYHFFSSSTKCYFAGVDSVGPKYAEKYVAAGAKTLATLADKVKLTRAQTIGLKHLEVSPSYLLPFNNSLIGKCGRISADSFLERR